MKFHGAASAWVAGATGSGEKIAIVDTGIFQANSEFAGRISPDSTDIIASRGTVEGEGDHGTLVAMVAAAANNGAGTVGIAYNATILAIRADEEGTCAADNCSFGDVGAAIDYAVDHGATVINLSLGGTSASSTELAAIQRAADAGIVVVVAAGNDGRNRPDPFPRSVAALGLDNVIIAGAVDSGGVIASFSNQASGREAYYLAALGKNVTVYLDGPQWAGDPDCPSPTYCQISGTSFSAPQIAGAVALIAQAFPNLTGAQIVDLLFSTAQDVGAPGIDSVYGHGILDIYEAFQPQGTTSLAGKTTASIPLRDTAAVGSPAMGDALGGATLGTVILDRYQRAFSVDLGKSMRGATMPGRLQNAIGAQVRSVSGGSDKAAVAFTIDASGQRRGIDGVSQLMLTTQDAEAAKVLAARIALRLSPSTQLGFSYAEGSNGLVMQLQGQDRPAFLIARDAGSDDGTFHRSDMAFALRRQFGAWGLTLSGDYGQTVSGDYLQQSSDIYDRYGRRTRDAVRNLGLGVDRSWGPLQTTLGLDWMNEERTVLGARFHEAFGGGGANTLFVDANAGLDLAPGWMLHGSLRNGWTFADQSSVIGSGSVIYSRAWSIDLEKSGVFSAYDRIGLRLAQPLRVEGGGLKLNLPVAYSYDTLSATFGTVPLSLSPEGHEIMGELAWHGPLAGGNASASVYYRRDPGHYAAMPDDKGVAVRWSTDF